MAGLGAGYRDGRVLRCICDRQGALFRGGPTRSVQYVDPPRAGQAPMRPLGAIAQTRRGAGIGVRIRQDWAPVYGSRDTTLACRKPVACGTTGHLWAPTEARLWLGPTGGEDYVDP